MQDKPMFTRGEVRVFDDGLYWEWAGRRRRSRDEDAEAHLGDLVNVPAKDLAAALRRFNELIGETSVHVLIDGTADEPVEFMPWSPFSFTLHGNKLVLVLDLYIDHVSEGDNPTGTAEQRIAPLLARKRLWLSAITEDHVNARLWHVELTIGFHLQGRSAADVIADGLEIDSLLNATVSGGLTRATCADLIRAGHIHVLLGQPEGRWLEVKREHYPISELPGKLRIAQTVAQFANSTNGGLVIIGLTTKKVNGVDTINAVTAQPRDTRIRRRYVQALQEHLYPPPDNLTIEVVAAVGVHGEGDVLLIDIPPQQEEHKPFLVHGAIADGKIYGSYISIVQRREDESVSTTAAAIHPTLVAGRALLRRGELPDLPSPRTQ